MLCAFVNQAFGLGFSKRRQNKFKYYLKMRIAAFPITERTTEHCFRIERLFPNLTILSRFARELREHTVLSADKIDKKPNTRLVASEFQQVFACVKKIPDYSNCLNILEGLHAGDQL